MKRKEKHISENEKTITIKAKVSVELKKLIDKERKLTGQTISKIVEKAVAHLFSPNQRLQTNQLREISRDLRNIVRKVDKIATKQASDKFEELNVVVVSKTHPWQNHPQKEKIYKLVRAMHRVGANSSMIASGLNLEGLKKNTENSEWKITDVKEIVEAIKQESDYLPPIYSLPDKPN